jgi:hypothetical protein
MTAQADHEGTESCTGISVIDGDYYMDGVPVDEDNMPAASDCYPTARFRSTQPRELQADICGNPLVR